MRPESAGPLPGGDKRVLLALGSGDGTANAFYSTEAAVAATPAWDPERQPPPLSSVQAVRIARAWLKQHFPADADDAEIQSVDLQLVGPTRSRNRWFYLIGFGPGDRPHDVVLLLDGTVVDPVE